MSGQLLKSCPVDFFIGGRTTFTLTSSSGEHKTYKILKPKNKDFYRVGLLTGSNNQTDYTWFGTMNVKTGEVTLFQDSQYDDKTEAVQLFAMIADYVFKGREFPLGISLQTPSRCCRCGRELTAPKEQNPYFPWMGPECGTK